MTSRKRLAIPLLLAAIISVFLYGAGLGSGLYANKIIAQRQAADSAFLLDNVESLERELQAYQVQERFLDSLSEQEACAFSQTYFEKTIAGLNDYWRLLPDRLEEYERDRTLTQEYIDLKERYIIASLRTWIIARQNHHTCGNNPTPLLYFYSSNCIVCIEQGKALDGAREFFAAGNDTIVVFTIDANADLPAVELITDYYGITNVPAIIVGDDARQGEVLSTEELIEFINEAEK
jgi:cell division protein FtsB